MYLIKLRAFSTYQWLSNMREMVVSGSLCNLFILLSNIFNTAVVLCFCCHGICNNYLEMQHNGNLFAKFIIPMESFAVSGNFVNVCLTFHFQLMKSISCYKKDAKEFFRNCWFHFHLFYCLLTGGCCGSTKKRTIVGGWAWAWWLVTDVQRLSLEVMTLNPCCEMVETAQGVPLTVTGVAQCKIMKVFFRILRLNVFIIMLPECFYFIYIFPIYFLL